MTKENTRMTKGETSASNPRNEFNLIKQWYHSLDKYIVKRMQNCSRLNTYTYTFKYKMQASKNS